MIKSNLLTGISLAAAVFVLPSCNSGKTDKQTEEDAGLTATAALDAGQETQDVTSDGTGTLEGAFDETTGELTFELKWEGLTGAPSMMHFHGPAAPGTDAGVKIPITDFPAEASGTVSQTVTVPEGDRADLLGGKWYVNIHTESYGAGEIRGQVILE